MLVVLPAPGARWPADASLRLHADGGRWLGLELGAGLLADRAQRIEIEGARGSRSPMPDDPLDRPERTLCVWCPAWAVATARRDDPELAA